MKIAIDIGHANGTGANGIISERAVVETFAPMLAELLQACGHTASVLDFPTRTNSGDLTATIAAVNAGGFDLCISLHADSSGNRGARGAHVCYYSVAGHAMAEEVADRLCRHMHGRAQKTVRRQDLAILRRTACTAILIELGFVTNPTDAELLSSPSHLLTLAKAITNGINRYAGLS